MQTKTDYFFEKAVNVFFLIVVFGGFAVATWLTIADISPAYEINTVQALLLDGDYFPMLTAVILIIPIVFVVLIVKTLIVMLFNLLVVKKGEPKIPYFYGLRWK